MEVLEAREVGRSRGLFGIILGRISSPTVFLAVAFPAGFPQSFLPWVMPAGKASAINPFGDEMRPKFIPF